MQNIAAKFNPVTRVQRRHSWQTDNRQTDGFAMHKTFERRLKSRAESGVWGSWGNGSEPLQLGSLRECYKRPHSLLYCSGNTYKRQQNKIFGHQWRGVSKLGTRVKNDLHNRPLTWKLKKIQTIFSLHSFFNITVHETRINDPRRKFSVTSDEGSTREDY